MNVAASVYSKKTPTLPGTRLVFFVLFELFPASANENNNNNKETFVQIDAMLFPDSLFFNTKEVICCSASIFSDQMIDDTKYKIMFCLYDYPTFIWC